MAEAVLVSCAATLLDVMTRSAIGDVATKTRYVTKFKTVVEDYRQGKESMQSILLRVQQDVKQAGENAEEIDEEVKEWMRKVEREMGDAQNLDESLLRRSPNMAKKYKLGKNAAKLTEGMAKLREESKFVRVGRGRAAFTGREFLSCEGYVSYAATKKAFNQTEEALRNVGLVGIYGMGGVGKTTLAKQVGLKLTKDPERPNGGIFDKVVMAVVSQNPNVWSIQDELAEMLGLKMDMETKAGRATLLKVRLQKRDEKVLVILDDIWKLINLAEIGIPSGEDSCKVVLTTRSQDVCNSMGCHSKSCLDVLSEDDSWELLKTNAGGIDEANSDLVQIAKQVTNRCQGLPLALVTVGRAMKDKTPNEWNSALKELRRSSSSTVLIPGVETGVYASIRLSYDYLNTYETKMCFLLCCLFPEDYSISIEELCLYAIGLGLYQEESTIEGVRCTINMVFQYLKASCLLLGTGTEGIVKMHDVVREVALWISFRGDHDFYVSAASELERWPVFKHIARHEAISLLGNRLNQLPPDKNKYPNLRILLLGKNEDDIKVPEAFFQGKQRLNVLDLSYKSRRWEMPLTLPTSLNQLTLLRGLYLRHCKLDDISTLGKLKSLGILSIRDSYLVRFPIEIGELEENLRMLDMSKCEVGSMCAKALGKLTHLEELYLGGTTINNWEVEGTSAQGSSAWLSQLTSLYHLSVFSANLERPHCIPEDFTLPNLTRYDISMNYSSKGHPNAKTLHVKDLGPSSLKAFHKLLKSVEYLSLQCLNGEICNIVPGVHHAGFDKLVSLKLKLCGEVTSIIDTLPPPGSRNGSNLLPQRVLSNLGELHIQNMDGFISMCIGDGVPTDFLSCLKVLVVTQCDKLGVVLPPSVMQGITKLEKVIVEDCKKVPLVFEIEQAGNHLKELRDLQLKGLPEMSHIWRGSSQCFICLTNLTSLKVINCHKLIYIFLPSFASSLAQLQFLTVKSCNNLEQIVHGDEEDEIRSATIPHYFPKLKTICVKECGRLTTLFLVKASRSLPVLETLVVSKASQLQNVFEVAGSEKKIELTQLVEVKLKDLPMLTCFASGDHHFTMPRLSKLTLQKCTKRIRASFRFTSGPIIVHVKLDHQVRNGDKAMDKKVTWDRGLNLKMLSSIPG